MNFLMAFRQAKDWQDHASDFLGHLLAGVAIICLFAFILFIIWLIWAYLKSTIINIFKEDE